MTTGQLNDEQVIVYPALWKTQLLHKSNPDSFADIGIILVANLVNIFLNFFGCGVVTSIFCHEMDFEVLFVVILMQFLNSLKGN